MNAYFIFATDDDTASKTLESLEGFGGRFVLVTNGYDSEIKTGDKWKFKDIRQAYSQALKLCMKNDYNAVFIRSGSQISSMDELLKQTANFDMLMATITDPKNTNMELTHRVESAFPIPRFVRGNSTTGTEEVFWVDGPVIYIKNNLIMSVGLIDTHLTEHFSLIDYSVRARWAGFKVGLCHDCRVSYVNEFQFSSVLDVEEVNITLGQHLFSRKYNGDILRSLIGK